MNDYVLIGDSHGKIDKYLALTKKYPKTIQLGDMAVGFRGVNLPKIDGPHYFIHGNHDNPDTCKEHPNFLGRFGVHDGIFFVSGAYSIDQYHRTLGISYWSNEELNFSETQQCFELYKNTKPKIVISHDCPTSLVEDYGPNSTRGLLQAMLDFHAPDIWLFGHHHVHYDKVHQNCRFICLAELEVFDLSDPKPTVGVNDLCEAWRKWKR